MPLSEHAAARKDARSRIKLEHRHFATIAAIILMLPTFKQRWETASHFAFALAKTNPKFDRERFMRACGFD